MLGKTSLNEPETETNLDIKNQNQAVQKKTLRKQKKLRTTTFLIMARTKFPVNPVRSVVNLRSKRLLGIRETFTKNMEEETDEPIARWRSNIKGKQRKICRLPL